MVHFSSALLPLALLSSALASAAPPNPDQLFKQQQSAASVASASSVAAASSPPADSHTAAHRGHAHHGGAQQVKRHLSGPQGLKYAHQRRAMGMQRRPASERRLAGNKEGGVEKRGGALHLGGRKEEVREREKRRAVARRGVVDSSETPDEDEDEAESDLQARGEVEERAATQYYLAGSSSAAAASSSKAAAAASSSSVSTTTTTSSSLSGAWKGVSSYYLFALDDADRIAVLDAIKAGGFKVVRIFVASVMSNNKGSGNAAVNDLEPNSVGTYDDTILEKIDQLMVECKARGLKLLIALSDRYALGFWSTDSYALKLNIVTSGSSGAQKVANAASFYTSGSAIGWFENRLKHIMSHKNTQLGKTWAELDEVIYAVEPQNEPQGHMAMASSTWACDRAAYLKTLIPSSSSILVSSGGGITTSDSLGSWATGCSSIDVISVHDYGTSASNTASALKSAQDKYPSKTVIMGEWGIAGANKAATISQFVSAFKAQGIPQMYWEVVKPGKAASDFEVWTDEPAWNALTGAAYYTSSYVAPTAAATTKAVAASSTLTKAAGGTTTQWHAATSSLASKVASAVEKATSAVAAPVAAKSSASAAGGAAADEKDGAAAATTVKSRESWKSASA